MHNITVNRRQILALSIASGALPGYAQANRGTMNFIVPQPAGNPSDGMARKIQPILQRSLGQTVIVENLPGAGGSIGMARTIAGAKNNTSLTIVSQTEPILTPLSVASATYKPEEFRCVGMLGRAPYVLVGRPDLPARTHAELMALVRRAGSAPLSCGHIGPGSMIHLLGVEWGRRVNGPLTQVPYKGVPPIVQDIMGSQIDLAFLPLAGTIPNLLESGKVRVYGSAAATPSPRLPALPLLSKQDPSLSSFVYGTWAAILVPTSSGSDFAGRMYKAVLEAVQDAEVQNYLDGTGLERDKTVLSMDQLDQFYLAETALYQRMARDIGIERQ